MSANEASDVQQTFADSLQCQESLEMALTSTPRERRNSSELAYLTSLQPIVYDSGNYCSSSCASDTENRIVIDLDIPNNNSRFQYMLREKDQALFLALQDVRKLRSELERLSKSEEWYKQELRTQKSSRLESLERLYSQERKYMQENQRLQRECVRLYENCCKIENELEEQKEASLKQLHRDDEINKLVQNGCKDANNKDFEIEQQKAIIEDQKHLIVVLRKQKRALLDDIKHLTEEKDQKILELQHNLASMEVENTTITAQCAKLLNERKLLEESLNARDADLKEKTDIYIKLQAVICDLKEQLESQQKLLFIKENEICELQDRFKQNLTSEQNIDKVHEISLTYHNEILAKTGEIAALKNSLHVLQEELASFAELQEKNENQERVIENLNFGLELKKIELEQLKQTDTDKAQQIMELQFNLEQFRNEKEEAHLALLQCQVKNAKTEKDLISLNQQYASMCELCERTKFELEIREIDLAKLNFQNQGDMKEILKLRGKLEKYLRQTADLNRKIIELETQLEEKNNKINKLESNKPVMKMLLSDESSQDSILLYKNFDDKQMDCFEVIVEKDSSKDESSQDSVFLYKNVDDKQMDCFEVIVEKDSSKEIQTAQLTSELQHNEDFEQLAAQNEQILGNISTQKKLIAEKQQLFEKFENLLNSYETEQNTCNTSQILQKFSHFNINLRNIQSLAKENEELKLLLSQILKTDSNNDLEVFQATRLQDICNVTNVGKEKIKELQFKLLQNDAKLYKIERADQQSEEENIDSLKQSFRAENIRLSKELLEAKTYVESTESANSRSSAVQQSEEENMDSLKQSLRTENIRLFKELLEGKTYVESTESANSRRNSAKTVEDLFKACNKKVMLQNSALYCDKYVQTNTENEQPQILLDAQIKNNLELENVAVNISCNKTEKFNDDAITPTLNEAQTEQIPAQIISKENIIINTNEIATDKKEILSIVNTTRNAKESADSEPKTRQEITQLKLKIEQLEHLLKQSISTDTNSGEQRIMLLNQLLDQQKSRVEQLNTSQKDWEDLLSALTATQNLQQHTEDELSDKRQQLEELNELFAEQNEELRFLQEYSFILESKRQEENEELRATFQQELNVIEKKFCDKLKESDEQKTVISKLKQKNANLKKNLCDKKINNSEALNDTEKEIEILKTQIVELTKERNKYMNRSEEMEREIMELKQTKRAALFIPEVVLDSKTTLIDHSETESLQEFEDELPIKNETNNSINIVDTKADTNNAADDRLRILTKVLESEYRRKMKRYDVHIHTLLNNINSLKASLKDAERRATLACKKLALAQENANDSQFNKRNFEELRHKFEQSQSTIKALELALDMERKKFESSDLGKSARQESVHEVSNLIDDYKKLIQQSSAATNRPKTSAILDLICRSNKCVPTLNKLELSVVDLRSDLENFVFNYLQRTQVGPSLMDELHAATATS